MRKLQRIIQRDHIGRLLDLNRVTVVFGGAQLTLPLFVQSLVRVASIAERLNGVNVERVFTHANASRLRFCHGLVQNLLVHFLRVLFQTIFLLFLLFFV